MKKILICSEAGDIRDFMVLSLKKTDSSLVMTETPDEALKLVEKNPECCDIVAAVFMRFTPGECVDFCKKMREISEPVGIMIFSGGGSEIMRITAASALESGADDFIVLPVTSGELNARAGALLRRVSFEKKLMRNSFIETFQGEFMLDHRERVLHCKDRDIPLTMHEYRMVDFFLANSGRELSRQEIFEAVWGEEKAAEINTVDVNIFRLRAKIEKDPSNPEHILTVWKKGYKWMP